MPHLLDLGHDVLHMIVDNIESTNLYQAQGDLCRLARTCRTLHAITTPYLFKGFYAQSTRRVRSFLYAILKTPNLGSRVKTIHFDEEDPSVNGDDGDEDDDNEDDKDKDDENEDTTQGGDDATEKDNRPILRASVMGQLGLAKPQREEQVDDVILTAFDSLGIMSNDDRQSWIEAINGQSQGPIFFILLAHLPNLESLMIELMGNADEPISVKKELARLFELAKDGHSTGFRCLKETELFTATQQYVEIQGIEPLLCVPSMRKIVIDPIVIYEDSWITPATFSNVEILEIHNSRIDNNAWPKFLQPFRKLKSLLFSQRYKPWDLGCTPEVLGQQLRDLRETLEYFQWNDICLEGVAGDLLGSFHDFPRLKCLDVQLGALIGTDEHKSPEKLASLLPRSIEEVRLWGNYQDSRYELVEDRDDCYSELADLVYQKQASFPLLQKIKLGDFDITPWMSDVCQENGISVELVVREEDDDAYSE